MEKFNVAILGATGAVGTELLDILASRNFPIGKLRLLALEVGTTISFRGSDHIVEEATPEAFRDIQIAFFAGGPISKVLAPEAVKAGAVVIDNSSAFRLDPNVPLIVPEVNLGDIDKHNGIIANPNCSTIIMALAINPIHQHAELKRVIVSTCQAVSGAGKAAVDELNGQLRELLDGRQPSASVLPVASLDEHYPIAFNLIPQIDVFLENGYTKEEWKMVEETHKILDSAIEVSPTAVRVPVYRGHSESINLEFERPCELAEVYHALESIAGLTIVDDVGVNEYPMAIHSEGKRGVYVGRIRRDFTLRSGINMWVVSDNLLKGAALNTVQIAEKMVQMGLVGHKEQQ